MGKSLVIVESPAKAKTINKFLGKNFAVEASMGHVRDLPKRKLGIDIGEDFEPTYQTIRGRGKVLARLRKLARNADAVYLAPDRDREGEAIAWHLVEALNLQPDKAKRVVFNEITKRAILQAFKEPTDINMNMVNAQQARRLLDRIFGYHLSPLLWEKISRGLSAGRVQSVATRLIVDREKEIRNFKKEEYWKISALIKGQSQSFESLLIKKDGDAYRTSAKPATLNIGNESDAKNVVDDLGKQKLEIEKVESKERQDAAKPPLTTSLLQQRASTQLGFSAKKTMLLAQQLYEGVEVEGEGTVGLITYMRTDSVRLADDAVEEIRQLILDKYGKKYLPEKPNQYKARKSAQEAHEAIRPTSIMRQPDDLKNNLNRDQLRLYKLIWDHTTASQMTPAVYRNTIITLKAGPYTLESRGRVMVFDGHHKALPRDSDDNQDLPPTKEGDPVDFESITPHQNFTQPPPRFTEASLVRALERDGIGRPSTYATTISTIQDRGYVEKKERKFFATELGELVNDQLVEHFPNIVDFKFTSGMENLLDSIAEEGKDWQGVLRDFNEPFQKALDLAKNNMKDLRHDAADSGQSCELCGKALLIRWSRRGKFLGCSGFPDCRNSRQLDEDGNVVEPETLKEQCPDCGSPLIVKSGRYGKFVSCIKYPDCKHTRSVPSGVPCPADNCDGELVKRRSKRGRVFYGCNRYPDCDFIANRLPKTEGDDKDDDD